MGFSAVLGRLPTLLRRIRQTADAVVAARPDSSSSSTAPDFTHRVANARAQARAAISDRRLRQPVRLGLAAGRAPSDARLCRSPAGAAALRARGAPRLGGPPTHLCRPSADRAPAEMRPAAGSADPSAMRPVDARWCCRAAGAPRSSRLMEPFGEALALLAARSRRVPSRSRSRRCRTCATRSSAQRTGLERRADRSCRARPPNGRPSAARRRGARRLRHGDAGTWPGGRPDGRRLQGLADRGVILNRSSRRHPSC